MQDFWLDVQSIFRAERAMSVGFHSTGYAFGERGGKLFPYGVEDLCILGLLGFVGYVCHGWDYDYEVGQVLSMGSLGFKGRDYDLRYLMVMHEREDGTTVLCKHCKCRGLSPVVWLEGLLYFDSLELEGDVQFWVLPMDVMDYLRVSGVVPAVSGGSAQFDLSVVDGLSESYTVVFRKFYVSVGLRCYGQKFARWLCISYLQWCYQDVGSTSLVCDTLALNREFMADIFDELEGGDDEYLEWLQGMI